MSDTFNSIDGPMVSSKIWAILSENIICGGRPTVWTKQREARCATRSLYPIIAGASNYAVVSNKTSGEVKAMTSNHQAQYPPRK